MEDLTEIKNIWTTVPDRAIPDFRQVTEAVRRYRRQSAVKIFSLTLFMLLLAAAMIWVIIDYNSQLLSTRIGEGLMISAIMIMLSYTTRSMRRLTSAVNYSNEGFLTFLKNEQLDHFRFQNRTQVIGFIVASTGLLMYLYEGVRKNAAQVAVTYGLVLTWIGISWFVIRPWVTKRKMARLEGRIRALERISQQLNDEHNEKIK